MVKMTGQTRRRNKRDSNKTKRASSDSAKICVICTGPAPGRNFGVVSCAACAAFFRKSIATNRHYKCRREMKCEFNKARRNHCRSCRMAKCLLVGMRKDLVQKTQSNQMNKQKENGIGSRESKSPHPSSRIDEDVPILEIVTVIEKQLLRPARSNPGGMGIFATAEAIEHFLLNDKMGAGDVYATVKSGNGLKEFFHSDGNREEEEEEDDEEEDKFDENKEADKCLAEPNACWQVDQLLCAIIVKCTPASRKISQEDKLCLFRYIKWPAMFMLSSFYSQLESANDLMTSSGISPRLEFQTAPRYGWDFRLKNMAEQVYAPSNLLDLWKRIFPSTKEFIFLLALLFSHAATPGLSVEGRQVLSAESSKLTGELVRFGQDRLGLWAGTCRYMEIMDLISSCFEAAHGQERLDTYMEIFHRLSNTTTNAIASPCQKPKYEDEERTSSQEKGQKCSEINSTIFYDLDNTKRTATDEEYVRISTLQHPSKMADYITGFEAISRNENNTWPEYGGGQGSLVFDEGNDAAMLLEKEHISATAAQAQWTTPWNIDGGANEDWISWIC